MARAALVWGRLVVCGLRVVHAADFCVCGGFSAVCLLLTIPPTKWDRHSWPRAGPVDIVIAARSADHVQSLLDLGGQNDSIGIIAGSESSTALRQHEDEINADRDKQGLPPIRPDIQRYDTVDELLSALAQGEVKAVIGSPAEITPLLEKYPTLAIAGPLKESSGQGFILGTNDLGQDELSRLVWGARVALVRGPGVGAGFRAGRCAAWPGIRFCRGVA